jgi:hypothetical protein
VFNIVWGLIWYGVETLLLKKFVGFSREERRQAFSSRMDAPFDVADFVARYSERRIRIADMGHVSRHRCALGDWRRAVRPTAAARVGHR